MKLTNEDKELLASWGFPEKDIKQIERAYTLTTYESNNKKNIKGRCYKDIGKRLLFKWSCKKHISLDCL